MELSTIDLQDGSVAEWKAILGPPTLQAADFSNSPTIPWDGSYDAADLTWSMWLGWSSSTGRLYVAIEKVDNEYMNEFALGNPFQFPGNDIIEFMVDGDHSGGEYGFAPDCCDTQEAWRRVHDSQAQHYLAIADAPDQQHLGYVGYGGASFAPSPATSWPYADAGGTSLGKGPTSSVIEFFVTPFDSLVWEAPERGKVSMLSPGKIIGFEVSLPDWDSAGSTTELMNYYTLSQQASTWRYAERFVDGRLLGPSRSTAITATSWGRIKASFGMTDVQGSR
ncbi:MAG: hypothetical protein IT369_05925 [Candidatus Latescibacteria bacterium]|nr:hypothetical protein [Candidatus Latescibacterota bacterium]